MELLMRALIFGTLVALAFPAASLAAPCTVANSVTQVKNVKIGSFEYVDFWVKKPVTASVSTWNSMTGSFEHDASGDIITLPGNRWRAVRFAGASWMCSPWMNLTTPKPRIKAVKSIGNFEGVVTFAIGRQGGSYLGMTVTNFAVNKRYRFKFN